MEIEALINYIRLVRNNTSVPVTTADDYNFWNKSESKSVTDEVDFIVVHIYPLWNGQTLENSIEWMSNIFFNEIKKYHSDKTIVLGEIGWATNYDSTKTGDGQQGSLIKGEVSYAAQGLFLLELSMWIDKNQVTTFLFEAFDEPWKGGGENSGPNEIEKHWGVFYENRIPKESFQNFLKAYETEKQ
jgi:exo-beta-1,3-glucanase (GH17 family)